VLTGSDCRKKAAESIRSAEAATNRKTRQDFCRTAQAWATLAEQVERDSLQPLSPPRVNRPADLLHRRTRPVEVIDAADVLRRRLRLADPEDEPFDSDLSD
jgi:hypothetical protein